MDNNLQPQIPPYARRTVSPVMKKIVFLFIFVLVLLIPLKLIGDLIDDRGRLYNQTITNIGNEWGKSQKIIAPVITVSYTDTSINNKDSVSTTTNSSVLAVFSINLAHFGHEIILTSGHAGIKKGTSTKIKPNKDITKRKLANIIAFFPFPKTGNAESIVRVLFIISIEITDATKARIPSNRFSHL